MVVKLRTRQNFIRTYQKGVFESFAYYEIICFLVLFRTILILLHFLIVIIWKELAQLDFLYGTIQSINDILLILDQQEVGSTLEILWRYMHSRGSMDNKLYENMGVFHISVSHAELNFSIESILVSSLPYSCS